FIFLESVSNATKAAPAKRVSEQGDELSDLGALIETVLSDQEEDMMYASELKSTLLRLRPDFNEGNYGCSTFGKFLQLTSQRNRNIRIVNDNHSVLVGLQKSIAPDSAPQLTKSNWVQVFARHLQRFKDDGFDRINPSILKSAIQSEYPDFDERAIGFKRFSDMLKRLEKEALVAIEMDEQHTMLIKIC
ncbi:MAG: OST-HTH/LOTUS domain-containing protein, partial [Christensenellales bacterium]